jgi:hypothetical protein
MAWIYEIRTIRSTRGKRFNAGQGTGECEVVRFSREVASVRMARNAERVVA